MNTLSTERQDNDIQAPQIGYFGTEAKCTCYRSTTLVTLTKQRVCFRTLEIQKFRLRRTIHLKHCCNQRWSDGRPVECSSLFRLKWITSLLQVPVHFKRSSVLKELECDRISSHLPTKIAAHDFLHTKHLHWGQTTAIGIFSRYCSLGFASMMANKVNTTTNIWKNCCSLAWLSVFVSFYYHVFHNY